jgi:uncharacterized protein YjiS (DUF1127 family)
MSRNLILAHTGLAGTSPVSRVLAGVLRQALGIVVALKNRRAVMQLAELDERALKDIGLVPTDVHGALAEPFYRDPSAILLSRSTQRRSGLRTPRVAQRG